ncbi:MAG: Gfo/Idh/MocA family oxidoreductase [Acidimicrobiia bacterium]
MTIRLGILAASRIARSAVVEAAPLVEGVEVEAIGARDPGRARAAAERWDIPLAVGSYAELVAADTVDAVYIGTPASLHRPWAIAAIAAGKHVLCEKPFAANAEDAGRIAEAARGGDRVVMEAYHWRYHPMAGQVRGVLASGVLGEVTRIEAAFEIADGHIPRTDIRWDLALGGGSTMDLGCYPIQWARFAAGADPEVVRAEAVCPVPGIDGSLTAELRWPSGATGRITSSMIADGEGATSWLRVTGTAGHLLATNPLAPQNGGARLVVETDDETTAITVDPSSTYVHQLAAFRDAIVDGAPFPTTADDGVLTMGIIDACYRAAGLAPRPAAD